MKTPFRIALLVLLLAGAYLAGRWHHAESAPAQRQAAARKILYYVCPMHPQYRSDRPGVAPCCGMRLEPVYADGLTPAGAQYPPGTVHIDADKQQLVGVRFASAETTDGTETLRAVARIAFDEKEAVVLADLLEHEASRVQVGQAGLVSIPFHPEQSFWARVDYVYPRIDTVTRTLKVRLQAPETGFKLLPDTFANVDFRIPGPRALTVPGEAVLNSGTRRVVFVDRGNGYLEPRDVTTGRRLGARVEIRRGLRQGDRVVVSGNFLIDSESQLQLASGGTQAMPGGAGDHDPVCGMKVDAAKAAEHATHGGRTYYFCSAECRRKFEGAPAKFVHDDAPAHAPRPLAAGLVPLPTGQNSIGVGGPAMEESGAGDATMQRQALSSRIAGGYATVGAPGGPSRHKDPVCGKDVDEKNAYRRTVEYHDVVLYFDSPECFREFMRNPELYGQRAMPSATVTKPRTQDVITPHTWDPPGDTQTVVKPE